MRNHCKFIKTFKFFLVSLLFLNSSFAEVVVVKHYQTQERYRFGEALLKLALSKVGNFKVVGVEKRGVNELRGELEVLKGNLDLEWMGVTNEREKKMTSIKLPIYRGLLGLRLILVTKENFHKISSIRDIHDLRLYTGGHGANWKDLNVYAANGLKVEKQFSYELLFKMLINGRFDYFHRGINEIWNEQKRYSSKLFIADNIMLYYNQPVFFYVNKEKKKLATQLKRGLEICLKDGSYKRLFLKHFGTFIENGNLGNRKMINLINPDPAANRYFIDKSWWSK